MIRGDPIPRRLAKSHLSSSAISRERDRNRDNLLPPTAAVQAPGINAEECRRSLSRTETTSEGRFSPSGGDHQDSPALARREGIEQRRPLRPIKRSFDAPPSSRRRWARSGSTVTDAPPRLPRPSEEPGVATAAHRWSGRRRKEEGPSNRPSAGHSDAPAEARFPRKAQAREIRLMADQRGRPERETRFARGARGWLRRLVSPAASLRLAALGAILFLDANEPQAPPVLPDDSGALDRLIEATQELIESFRLSHLDPHAFRPSSPRRARPAALPDHRHRRGDRLHSKAKLGDVRRDQKIIRHRSDRRDGARPLSW